MNTSPPCTRRDFLKKTGKLTMASLVSVPEPSFRTAARFKMGLQLYTIREAMAKDPLNSLKVVAQLGYQDLETYGYHGAKDTYYGYRTSDFKRILEDLQLTVTSGHYPFSDYFMASEDALRRFVDQCIVGAKGLNSHYITWPWLAPQYRSIEHFKRLADTLNRIGEQVTQAGLGFAYHNHDFEFTDHHGEKGYDSILYDTDAELVKLQMDMYWVERASQLSPKQLIDNHPDRYVMWHIKDMDETTRDYTELGNGAIDYVSILSDIDTQALDYYYLEQGGNFAQDAMQSIADSAAYFKKHLQKYL